MVGDSFDLEPRQAGSLLDFKGIIMSSEKTTLKEVDAPGHASVESDFEDQATKGSDRIWQEGTMDRRKLGCWIGHFTSE